MQGSLQAITRASSAVTGVDKPNTRTHTPTHTIRHATPHRRGLYPADLLAFTGVLYVTGTHK